MGRHSANPAAGRGRGPRPHRRRPAGRKRPAPRPRTPDACAAASAPTATAFRACATSSSSYASAARSSSSATTSTRPWTTSASSCSDIVEQERKGIEKRLDEASQQQDVPQEMQDMLKQVDGPQAAGPRRAAGRRGRHDAQLMDYEFMDQDARQAFDDLVQEPAPEDARQLLPGHAAGAGEHDAGGPGADARDGARAQPDAQRPPARRRHLADVPGLHGPLGQHVPGRHRGHRRPDRVPAASRRRRCSR